MPLFGSWLVAQKRTHYAELLVHPTVLTHPEKRPEAVKAYGERSSQTPTLVPQQLSSVSCWKNSLPFAKDLHSAYRILRGAHVW